MIAFRIIAPFFFHGFTSMFIASIVNRLLFALVIAVFLTGGGESYPQKPEEVVYRYLDALKNYDFPEAFQYLSSEMSNDKDVWNWSVEQKHIFEFADVHIDEFTVYEAEINDDRAFVPNILKSRDKFLNKDGIDEYELYELKKSDGDWIIDRQKLVTKKKRDFWFRKPYRE